MDTSGIVCRELEPRLWLQLEALFGMHGACGGCWCWHWRLAEGEHWDDVKGEVAHERLHQAVQSGSVHGMLAFDGETSVGWCSFEPRASLPRLERSPRFKGRPAERVWFVGCFFIQRSWRRRGLAELLLGKAIEVMEREGARAVEAVPTATHGRPQADAFLFTGTYEMFERLGFHTTMDARGKTTVMRREFIQGVQCEAVGSQ
ncbi:MAG TPA: GNAT family N-acetyltransferase [Candidatus Deferrimicrobium sp.]|nr:GNAT family N-acetyltransferase [Candidatus Deferrimicrobium sp.]